MIQLKDVNFSYRKGVPLFTGLNLQLENGHIYGLLGKNGAGKTTLMKIICGLRFAQSGVVSVLDHPAQWRHPSMLQDLFYLGEEIWAPDLSVQEFVAIYSQLYPHFSNEQMQTYLQTFDVPDSKQHISKMSHGQKKKVMLAFALATNVKLLLMDEPTNGLDIPSKSIFRKVMTMACDPQRMFLISTHQVRDLHSLIDSILLLDKGEIVINATTDEITDKLLFQVVDSIDEVPDALYTEDTLRGFYTVSLNKTNQPSKLDLELFFNAVLAKRSELKQIFNEM